jgi:hypothetical protein
MMVFKTGSDYTSPQKRKVPKVLLERLELWGLKRGAGKIMLYSWNNRKGYHRAMERLGLNTHGYIYSREIQNEN